MLLNEPREIADALRSATRAALLRFVPPGIFQASIVGVDSGDSRGAPGAVLLTYSLAGQIGVLRLSGSPPVVLKDSDWRPAGRARLAVFGGIGLAAAAVAALRLAYSSQHEWFARYGHGSVVGTLGLLGVIALIPAVYGALLPRAAWSARTVWMPAMAAMGLAFAASASCHIAGPSLRDALARLQSNDQASALMEADALIASGIDRQGGRTVLDTVHLAQARAARSVEEIASRLRETWYDDAARKAAVAILEGRARDEAATMYAAGDAGALERIAAIANSFEAGEGAVPHALASLARARKCGEQSDWRCATSEIGAASAAPTPDLATARDTVAESARRELQRLANSVATPGSIRAQRDRLAAMNSAATCVVDLTGLLTQPSPSELQAALAPIQQQVALLERREAANAEASRRQQEALDNRRRAQEEAAQRIREAQEHEANRAVLCSDGSYSGCLCHADSHQGCCSHHGGIAGCAP